jgi:large subunit ribosomal protein L1
MAKKPELLEKAKKLKLDVTAKNTIAQLEEAIKNAEAEMKPEKVEKIEKETAVGNDNKTAKAGKRSEKSLKEAEEKAAKEDRKTKGEPLATDMAAHAKKGEKPKVRPLIERRGKNYRKVAELVEKSKLYPLTEALEIAVQTNPSKFDASMELHIRLGVDPRQADQNIRATVSLPNGTGKTIKVAAFCPDSEQEAVKKEGADIVGDEDFLRQLDKEGLDFDILITTPQYMPKLGIYARLLGPRGLMPNPKSGSVASNLVKAIKEAKSGKVEYRVDKQAIIHLGIGKVSFGAKKLEENANAFFNSLKSQRPTSLKGVFVKSTAISTTQGPGIKVENVVN